MTGAVLSTAVFGLPLAPSLGMTAAERYAQTVGLSLTPAVGMTGSAITAVRFDAAGAGWGGGGSPSWLHTINGSAVALPVLFYAPTSTMPTITAKIGTTPMNLLGGWTAAGGYANDGSNWLYLPVFGLLAPPQGPQTISISMPSGLVTANSLSYKNVSSFGTLAKASGLSTSFAVSASSAAGQMVMNAFGGYTGTLSGYTQTQRYLQQWVSATNIAMVAGDAAGAPTVNFAATCSSSAGWGGITLPLVP
jgi:hypothetical protein